MESAEAAAKKNNIMEMEQGFIREGYVNKSSKRNKHCHREIKSNSFDKVFN